MGLRLGGGSADPEFSPLSSSSRPPVLPVKKSRSYEAAWSRYRSFCDSGCSVAALDVMKLGRLGIGRLAAGVAGAAEELFALAGVLGEESGAFEFGFGFLEAAELLEQLGAGGGEQVVALEGGLAEQGVGEG